MQFADVTGQTEIKERLRRSVDSGRISHAQLFTGDCGWGTLPLAVAYAQYVNCTNRHDGDSCGVCPSCIKYSKLEHPDLHFVFPSNSTTKAGREKPTSDYFLPQWRELSASTGMYFDEQMWYSAIGIENQQGVIAKRESEEVIRKLSFKSFEAEYKVVVIWLPERMCTGNNEAANVLLKTLEEPWEKTLFLLVSAKPEMLLPTILSRTQQIEVTRIDPVSLAGVARTRYGADEGQATVAAHLAEGSMLGLRGVLSEEFRQNSDDCFQYFTALMRLSYNDRHIELLDWSEQVAALGREAQKRVLTYTLSMLRESYTLSCGMNEICYLWGSEREFCVNFAPYINQGNIETLVALTECALRDIGRNGNPKMVFGHYALSVSKQINRR